MTSGLEERAGQPSAPATQVSIGLMGLGVVGSGVAKVLQEKAAYITQEIGCPIELRRVLVRDMGKARDVYLPEACFTTDPEDILSDPEISIVIELMGGEDPAFHSMEEALRRGKHVITANKEVIAKHGPHLLSLAERSNTSLLYEAQRGRRHTSDSALPGEPPSQQYLDPARHYQRHHQLYPLQHGERRAGLCRLAP